MKVKKNSRNTRLQSKGGPDIQIFTPKYNEEKESGRIVFSEPRTAESAGLEFSSQRVAVYARVSTNGQEREDTIESQLCQLKKHTAALGIVLADDDIYQDNGFSGANMNRSGLEELRDKVAAGHYDIVFVLDPDRLARRFVLQMILLDEFKSHNCQLQFVKRPIGESPEEQLLLQVQGVISEYESAKIQERTRRGKLHRMKQGEIVTGRPTFGYNYISKQGDRLARYEINEEEAAWVKEIFRWYTFDNVSIRGICRRLSDFGVETVKGRPWSSGAIHSILKHSLYTGTGYANKEECLERSASIFTAGKITVKKRTRPREEWIPFSAPVIIDDETFELTQNKLKLNSQLASRNTKGQYLLRSLLVCGECQRRMRVYTQGQKYICFFSRPSGVRESRNGSLCGNKVKLSVPELDAIVWKTVKAILDKPSSLKNYYNKMHGEVIPKASGGNIDKLLEKRRTIEQQINRLNKLFISGVLSENDHKKQYNDLKGKLNTIQLQSEKLNKEYLNKEQINEMLESFKGFAETIKNELNDIDFETKRKIVELMIKQVIIDKKKITIEYFIPIKKRNLCLSGEGIKPA